jgi:DNA polymerase (family 10)
MDSRTAAHVLSRIAAYLELTGESAFKSRAYESAGNEIRALLADDLAPLYRSGELGKIRGLGPATLAVIGDLIDTGESRYLEQLEASTPKGLIEMLDIPGLSAQRIRQIHQALSIETVEELEAAASDGRLAGVPKIGPKTTQRILDGIAAMRARGSLRMFHHAMAEARQLLDAIRSHPDVRRAEIAGGLRRRLELVERIEIVAECVRDPTGVAQSFTRLPGVRSGSQSESTASMEFVDGTRLVAHCAAPEDFGVALWRATGNDDHIADVIDRLAERGAIDDEGELRLPAGADESTIYRAAGLSFIEPELREGLGEVDAAARGALPDLLRASDVRGVLHCHTHYSDGRASLAAMVDGARARGWSYLGITDHSQAAFYVGGMTRDKILAQHEEIDALNDASGGIRVLKGVEADILVDGRLDYDDDVLGMFDFVVGSVHSQFAIGEVAMTQRIMRALDNPHLTILGHPTGRQLLRRNAYPVNLDAVIDKAISVGVAIELNCEPRRSDLDWRHLRLAVERGATIEIGPDAHSVAALDNVEVGVGLARKGWLTRGDVLNARPVEEVLAFARRRREKREQSG